MFFFQLSKIMAEMNIFHNGIAISLRFYTYRVQRSHTCAGVPYHGFAALCCCDHVTTFSVGFLCRSGQYVAYAHISLVILSEGNPY